MAMLAEPRRKQKVINLRAKNSAWSNDTNKFGQRMLEKMGWSSGKGLGAKENGIVEHVVARYKNDEKGLGFEDRNDQWTKHEDDFNALLANLSNGDDKEPQSHSGVSLEVKSKKSKARVHFHKFTRAKDLSRYSEKDLANIFGKKALKSEVKKEEILKDNVKTTEQVFTEKGSMTDYFKNKMQALSSKSKMSVPTSDNGYEDADCGFQGFSGATNDNLEPENTCPGFGFSFYTNMPNCVKDEPVAQNDEIKDMSITEDNLENVKKNKKKKKTKKIDDSHDKLETISNLLSKKRASLDSDNDNCMPYELREDGVSKKKKKSKLDKLQVGEPMGLRNEDEIPKKKKSKNKNSINLEIDKHEQEDKQEEENYVPKKKKKKKNKDL